MSCDGSIGVVQGAWSRGAAIGWFTSVWQRENKGKYKWLLRQDGTDEAEATVPPDMLSAIVADCPPRPARPVGEASKPKQAEQPPAPVEALTGYSTDKTLLWRSGNDAEGTRRLLVRISKDETMQTVLGGVLDGQPDG
jgi:hypothetical protein